MFGSATAPVPSTGTATAPGRFGVGRPHWPALPHPRVRAGARSGRASIAFIVLVTLTVVLVATSGPSVLVPRSTITFPAWMAGPLNALIPLVSHNPKVIGIGYTVVLITMFGAYLVVLGSAHAVSLRLVLIAIGALELILLIGPPLQLNDVFNYLGYARLGALHGLNPYTHVIKQEFFDPVYRFSSWHNLRSPYGSLFSAFTYPLATLPLPVAYWLLKLITVAMSGVFLALVWRCARQLGRDPRYALMFVAFNPIFLLYAVGGFHNDFFMLVPSMGAISLMLDGRDRSAGAAVVLAIAVKFTAVLLLPFLLVAVATRPRQRRIVSGAALGALPMIALSLAMFGLSLPNLVDQSALLTDFSIPNLVGDLIGAGGGAPWLLKLADVAVVAVVLFQLQRRRDWMAGAAWSTFALLASLAWLVPWYVVWLLPLAVLAGSVPLRRVAIAATLFLIFAFMPGTGLYFAAHGVNLLSGDAGQASRSHQTKLAQ